MKNDCYSASSDARVAGMPPGCSIAIDEELLSLVTSDEAAAVTPLMSHVYLSLINMVPEDVANSLPVAQEWLFEFSKEDDLALSPREQLQQFVVGIDEEELQQALDWMQEHHIIDLRNERANLYVTIRNALITSTPVDGAK